MQPVHPLPVAALLVFLPGSQGQGRSARSWEHFVSAPVCDSAPNWQPGRVRGGLGVPEAPGSLFDRLGDGMLKSLGCGNLVF